MHSDIDRLTRLTRSDVDCFFYISCMIINVYVACLIRQRAVCNACFAPACYQGVMAIVERMLHGITAVATANHSYRASVFLSAQPDFEIEEAVRVRPHEALVLVSRGRYARLDEALVPASRC